MKPNRLSLEFGRRLRRLRRDAGMNQQRFAVLTRIEQNHISKLERGERLPSYHTFRRLMRVLPTSATQELLLL